MVIVHPVASVSDGALCVGKVGVAIKCFELMKACCQPSNVSLQDLMSEIMIMWVISSARHNSGAILIIRVCVYVLYLHPYES